MKKTIEINPDLYSFLEEKAKFGEVPNDVIARLTGFYNAVTETNSPARIRERVSILVSKGVNFWEGMKLRAAYKGREYIASVINGKILYNGKGFGSPSAAAVFICNNSVNGWTFWEYYDESAHSWKPLSDLRK